MKSKSIAIINNKIKNNNALVLTAYDFHKRVAEGEKFILSDVDVLACGSKSIMSGTYAIGSFKIGLRGENFKPFRKIKKLYLNNIDCPIGCPNESLQVVDFFLIGTHTANKQYGGGHLFRDLVSGKDILYLVETDCGQLIFGKISINEMEHLSLHATRNGMRNYTAFTNPHPVDVKTIFSVKDMKSYCSEITFSGSGAISPLQNDVDDVVRAGYPILVNGSIGMVIGDGTRSNPERRNLMITAPMKGMKEEYMGGFNTSYSPEIIQSLGIAFPITNEKQLAKLHFTDKDIPLPIVDVIGRDKIADITYDDVWNDNNQSITYTPKSHKGVLDCPVERECPTGAYTLKNGIDKKKCFNCGHCVYACPHQAFYTNLGDCYIDGRITPITLRQTDRFNSIRYSNLLKRMIENGIYPIV